MKTVLRDYQLSAIEKTRALVRAGKTRVVIYAPTGAGKAVIAAQMIMNALEKGKRVAFIVNRIQLVKQMSERLIRAGVPHGIIQGENTKGIDRPVLVCSIQTVARRWLPPVDLVLVDEGHSCPGSRDYRRLIELHNAIPITAFSATPFAKGMGKEELSLGGALFQGLVVSATIKELIAQGFLVDVDIYAPSEPDLSGVAMKTNEFGERDYVERDLEAAVNTPKLVGDIVGHWLAMARHKPTVCFATSIAHSKSIVREFEDAGIPAEHIDAYTDEAERAAILARVASGRTRIVSNVSLLAEGWDFPACEVMILARPTKSLTRYVQMAGRILRPYEGKTRALILDHSGSAHALGYPTDDLPLWLDTGAPKKASAAVAKEKLPKLCPSCKFLKPVGVHACPKCGFAPERKSEVGVSEGTLTLVKRKASQLEKQDAYSQLLAVCRAKRYGSGWLAHKYRALFGVWPRGMEQVPKEPTPEISRWLVSQAIRYAKSKEKADANKRQGVGDGQVGGDPGEPGGRGEVPTQQAHGLPDVRREGSVSLG